MLYDFLCKDVTFLFERKIEEKTQSEDDTAKKLDLYGKVKNSNVQ